MSLHQIGGQTMGRQVLPFTLMSRGDTGVKEHNHPGLDRATSGLGATRVTTIYLLFLVGMSGTTWWPLTEASLPRSLHLYLSFESVIRLLLCKNFTFWLYHRSVRSIQVSFYSDEPVHTELV